MLSLSFDQDNVMYVNVTYFICTVMHIAKIYSILENGKTSSFNTYMFSTGNPNVAFSTDIRMLWSLYIGMIALNKAIKGKGRSKGVSIIWGADCIPGHVLEKEEGITFSCGYEATFFSFLPSTYFFLFISGLWKQVNDYLKKKNSLRVMIL